MKTVIFDFDGVIHDTFELAYKISSSLYDNKLTKRQYRDFFNGNVFEDTRITEKTNIDFFKLQNEAFKNLKIEPAIKNNLLKLSRSNKLFIISSNQEEILDEYFQNNKATNIFTEILGSQLHRSKIHKFKYLFKKYQLSPEDCVFVTDTLGDILEANQVGVKIIAVDFGFHKRSRLTKGKPFKIVSSFDELIIEINNINNF